IRRQLSDDNRRVRVYGAEVVICRLTADTSRSRLHLLNYSGREVDGLRVRLRGNYGEGEARAVGYSQAALEDFVVADGATEFTIPKMGRYAMVELPNKK
ncbi:MAG: hypothetical protein L0220_20425, partial [Acidobacteria bacterium]|nr:hypothetical protein [Acidobacteriota bacterium]